MKITELLRTKGAPALSFEMTRPKTPKGEANIGNVLNRIIALKPDFLTMTFGAGGVTADASLQMLRRILIERKQEVVAHLAGFGMSAEHLDATVNAFSELGVENMLVIRGDRPQDPDFEPESGSLDHASEMIGHLHPRHDMCIGAAAYPEAHVESADLDSDIEHVKQKISNGASFIICQYFYDNEYYFKFIRKCRDAGIEVPILVGVMPIYSVKMMRILASICGATITDEVNDGLAAIDADDRQAVNAWGIDFAIRQCKELLSRGVDGLHFYTLNRSSSVTGIINGLRAEGLLKS